MTKSILSALLAILIVFTICLAACDPSGSDNSHDSDGNSNSHGNSNSDGESNNDNSNDISNDTSNDTSNDISNDTSDDTSNDTGDDTNSGDKTPPRTLSAISVAKGVREAGHAFAIDMLKQIAEEGENSMISPLSALLALGMTANGAEGTTLAEFESVLCGGKTITEFNDYYGDLVARITKPTKGSLSIANSVWYRDEKDRIIMNESFLDKVKKVYDSEVRPADFYDPKTVDIINDWVKQKTRDKIDGIIDEIENSIVIYLINAIYFEQKWQSQYNEYQVSDKTFHSPDADTTVPFMTSEERSYIEDKGVKGFSKSYEDTNFSFIALLPDKNTGAEDYLATLTGEKLINIIENRQSKTGMVSLPKFKSEFSAPLKKPLLTLGLKKAFDPDAEFKSMANTATGMLFVSDVRQKTFIEVNEAGTKAAAVTIVEMVDECAPDYTYDLVFDRPFIYMIIDEQTSLPLFIGILNNP